MPRPLRGSRFLSFWRVEGGGASSGVGVGLGLGDIRCVTVVRLNLWLSKDESWEWGMV